MTFDKDDFFSVDPGVRYFAWACWFKRELYACGVYCDTPKEFAKGYPCDSLIIEDQQVFAGQESKKADIIDLAQAAGGLASHFDNVIWVAPLKFPKPKRGQMSIPELRGRKYLDSSELNKVLQFNKADLEHIWDAVYFGLKHLGRF